SATVELEFFDQIQPEPIRWLWYHRIPRGKLTLYVGHPEAGKSLAAVDLIARLTRGQSFPDGASCEQGKALVLELEDGKSDTTRPRLDSAGADVSRVARIKAVKITLADGASSVSPFNLERDLERLEQALAEHPDTKLIVISPLSGYLGKINS